MGKKHIPIRTCIACRTSRPKRELVRIVRTPEGELVLDADQKARGRGAYLCRRRACWERLAQRPKMLGNALKRPLAPEDVDMIRRYIETAAFEEDEPIDVEQP
nr:YlxR family protein [Ardenticatena sp.]